MGSKPIYHQATSSPLGTYEGRKLVLSVAEESGVLYTRYQLLEAEGFAVISASDAAQALDLFSAWAPDLVVLNYELNHVTGDVVAEAMKKHMPHVPIIMVVKSVELVGRCSRHADAFVATNDSPNKLLRLIQKSITDGPAQQGEQT